MYFDIIYNSDNNNLVQIIPFNDKISASSTSDLHHVFNYCKSIGVKNYKLVPWVKDLPKEVLQNPKNYEVIFENAGYAKPTFIKNIKDNEKINLGLNTKIKDNKIIWFGSFLDYISYSNVTREIAFHLENNNYNISYYSTRPSGIAEVSKDIQEKYEKRKIELEDAFVDDCLKVISYVPLSKVPHCAFNISYTMLETFSVSEYVANTLKTYPNEIWVPTNYTKNQFQEHVDDRVNIEVMPLWFDEDKFKPNPRKYDCKFDTLNTEGDFPLYPVGYKFLCVSRYTTRKGFDILLKAFAEEFDRTKDDVSLVLFCRHILNMPNFNNNVYETLKGFIKGYDQSKIPPIYIHSDPLEEKYQGEMYGWGDCHVMPSRGEGFGLTALEAAACKIPQILTNHTGLSDFVDDEVAMVIDTDQVDSCGKWETDLKTGKPSYKGRYPEWIHYLTPYYSGQKFMVGGRECIEQTKQHMRALYNNDIKNIQDKVDKFYQRAHEKYNKNLCLSKIQTRIDEILRQNS